MKKILLAEDEEVLRMLIVDTLEEQDYLIHEASDGQEALHYIEKNEYDLLILDYMMPEITGLELIKHIRGSLHNHEVKILMLSAKSQQFEQEKVLEAGANYFIAKPFSPMELLTKIEGILHENE
ncbi:response regulator [Bacillus sp. APMAM]|uniref:response regulator transcription factor n=1 Tax=Margalitia sp. FSL K6-0131 TaxID=2954604 RepID=UPI000F86C8E3|nr:response regulator [Bacillus sp. APMAM]RTZ54657.1 response regulator [Bacillus sp. SAJ1]